MSENEIALPPLKQGEDDRLKRKTKIKKALRFKQKRLAVPYGVLIALFVVIPLIIMMVDAFRGTDGKFTLSNFDRFWAGGGNTTNLWRTVGDTFLLALATTVICFIICYPLALALNRLKTNKKAILVMLFVAPMWINSLLRIYAIKLIFTDVNISDFWLVLIAMVYDFFPFMLLPIYTSIANTDKSYFEAAGDLGANSLKTFVKVTLPLSKAGIVSGIIMVFMPAMSTFAISDLLARGTFMLFGNLIETNMLNGIGSAYSLVLLIIVAITFIIANKFSSVSGESRGEGIL